MSSLKSGPRTYNQIQLPRRYALGKRRFSIYWTWSYPWEANRDVTELDNRFSTITEVRRVAWPNYETQGFSAQMFLQGIAGTLELFHLSTLAFQRLVGEVTEERPLRETDGPGDVSRGRPVVAAAEVEVHRRRL